jgi:SAM-dependent methyltransferase
MMRALRGMGWDSMAWSLRRFHTPVAREALVLEVGSGGNPYPRSNVLLDAYEATRERHWVPLAADRPTVLGFVENLPFKDGAFDFVIAAHVLEHSTDPEAFLAELQRVAKAGYIEVPDAFMERVNPYRDHRLEITCRDQTLVIRKKRDWRHDPEVVEIYEDRVKRFMTRELMPSRPFEFHVRYYWDNRIAYTVVNPEVDANWTPPVSSDVGHGTSGANGFRHSVRGFLRGLLSQRARNARLDLLPLLRCTHCYAEGLRRERLHVVCGACGTLFPVRERVVAMNEGHEIKR